MTETELKTVKLISSALLGEKLPGDFVSPDLIPDIMKLSASLDMSHLAAKAITDAGITQHGDELYKKVVRRMHIAIYRAENQNHDSEQISGLFEKENIDYLPLKGSIIRKYYPEAWMRTCSDIDILVREKDVDRAARLLQEKLGYEFHEKGDHDIGLRSPGGTAIEIHYRLIEGRFAASGILDGIWDKVVLSENKKHGYEMPGPLFYFYHIAHAAKHFEQGGCGMRPVADIYEMKKSGEYKEEEYMPLLKEAGLEKFCAVLEEISNAWFGGGELSEVSERSAEYILNSGTFGTAENKIAVQQIKKGGKKEYALERIFVPYDKLVYHYPILRKHKILYPACQVRRWFRLLFNGSLKRSVNELKVNENISDEKLDSVGKLMKDVGIL